MICHAKALFAHQPFEMGSSIKRISRKNALMRMTALGRSRRFVEWIHVDNG